MRTTRHLLTLAEQGMDWAGWYTWGKRDIREVSRRMEWDPDLFTDILALTSPRISVKRNIRVSMDYMRTGVLDSRLIRSTHVAVAHYRSTGEIRGPKTSAFARALRGDLTAVVLDVWMSVALGVDQRKFSTKGTRTEAEHRVVEASQELDLAPAEAQAAVWAGTVRSVGRAVRGFDISEELALFDVSTPLTSPKCGA